MDQHSNSVRTQLHAALTSELRRQVMSQRVLVTACDEARLPIPLPTKLAPATAVLTAARIEQVCRVSYLGVVLMASIWILLSLVTAFQGATTRILVKVAAAPHLTPEDREILVELVSFTDVAVLLALGLAVTGAVASLFG